MNENRIWNRRDFLRLVSAGSALAMVRPAGLAAAPDRRADLELALTASPARVNLLPGSPTAALTYHGEVLNGDPASVQALPGSYLGPILRMRRGQRIRVLFNNGLDQESIVHWHGLHVPADMDGHPRYAVKPGGHYRYEFTVRDRAGTYWFHPHPHGRTGGQVYSGLAGLLLVTDDEERSLDLPAGEQDVPLIIQDRGFDADNQFAYLDRRRMGMMDRMMGFLGDRILVNGRPDFTLRVARQVYRLRLLNGSNSRLYKLAWDDGTPLVVIATDGGLLERPVSRPYVMLAPGERIELWADFSGRAPGSELVLRSLPFAGAMVMGGMMGRGMMGGTMGGGRDNGAAFPVMTVSVEDERREARPLPARLAAVERYRISEAVNRNRPRVFRLTMGHMQWGINGRGFDMTAVADDETVRLDTLELWEFRNDFSAGMMGAMPHPMHIHGVQFQVVGREVAPALARDWQTVRAGYVDEGWKDTVLLMPGERLRLLVRFHDHPGLFVYHCHNLEHSDMGMMRNYRVRA